MVVRAITSEYSCCCCCCCCCCMALQLSYRVLAFSTNFSFHPLLSCVRVFQSGTLSFCIAFLISSIRRVFGLPVGLLEMGYQEYIAFTILVPCILSTVRAVTSEYSSLLFFSFHNSIWKLLKPLYERCFNVYERKEDSL